MDALVNLQGNRVRGLQLRGVVLAAYVERGTPFCDALIYSTKSGQRVGALGRIEVTFGSGGVHEGETRLPKAASVNLATGGPIDQDTPTAVADMDGDHILIGFIDDDIDYPVMLRYLRHPRAGIGSSDRPVGPRISVDEKDDRSDMRTFHGISAGVDGEDFVIDARFANAGVRSGKGFEGRWKGETPEDPDGTQTPEGVGSVRVKLRDDQEFQITLAADESEAEVRSATINRDGLAIENDDVGNVQNQIRSENFGASAALTVGDGEESAARASIIQEILNTILPLLVNHTHTYVFGLTGTSPELVSIGPTTAPPGTSNVDAIASDKLKMPE